MKVTCPHCGGKAHIGSRNDLNDKKTVSDLYVYCIDIEHCGATGVYSLAFKHTINPPQRTVQQMALAMVNRLTKEEKAGLQRDMFAG